MQDELAGHGRSLVQNLLDGAKVEMPAREVLEIDCALALLTTHLEESGDPLGADEVRGLKNRVIGRYPPDGMLALESDG